MHSHSRNKSGITKHFYCFLLTMFFSPLFGQDLVQLGNDISGNGSDQLGDAVAISADGNIFAVGVRYGNPNWSGYTKIYKWNGSALEQLGSAIDGIEMGENAGHSVALNANGDIVAIGATGSDSNGNDAGRVGVYVWDGSANWVQRGQDIIGEAASDWLGESISLNANGNILAIGAGGNDGNGNFSGHVRVYEWNGNAWVQRGADIDGEAPGDFSGRWGLELNTAGDIVAISATQNDGNGMSSGHVRVFQWDGNVWQQLGADIDGQAGSASGDSIALNGQGDLLAIGTSHGLNSDAVRTGFVSIFSWDGQNWIQRGDDIDGDAHWDRFGHSVSLNSAGDVLVVGAIQDDMMNPGKGYTRV